MKAARIMLVDDTPSQSVILEQALLDQELTVVCRAKSAQGLIKNVEVHQPDLIIMDLASLDQDTLDNMTMLNQHNPKPMILFSKNSDSQLISQAVQAGASAYVVDGLESQRIKPIMDAAIARFNEFQALKTELQKTQGQLADRKVIDQAKGLLMKTKSLNEEQAYHTMRKMAMDQSKPIADIAKNILSVMSLLSS
ncbi:hypothetical protein A9R00_01685 [Oleispira antarctica]|uniref:Response regulator n=1 Tax=Oleispira antarctica TaxID=188908 RepID=A0A1Y5HVF4_OLEAN|nr:hypothetical protein A9R00_01685 [Oleispira antarctica]